MSLYCSALRCSAVVYELVALGTWDEQATPATVKLCCQCDFHGWIDRCVRQNERGYLSSSASSTYFTRRDSGPSGCLTSVVRWAQLQKLLELQPLLSCARCPLLHVLSVGCAPYSTTTSIASTCCVQLCFSLYACTASCATQPSPQPRYVDHGTTHYTHVVQKDATAKNSGTRLRTCMWDNVRCCVRHPALSAERLTAGPVGNGLVTILAFDSRWPRHVTKQRRAASGTG